MDNDEYIDKEVGGEAFRMKRRQTRYLPQQYPTPPETRIVQTEPIRKPVFKAVPKKSKKHSNKFLVIFLVSVLILAGCSLLVTLHVKNTEKTQPVFITYNSHVNVNTLGWTGKSNPTNWIQTIDQPAEEVNKTLPVNAEKIPSNCPKADYDFAVKNRPSIPRDFPDKVLKFYGSPAVGKGTFLWDEGVKRCVNPAMPLAFFMHESSFGKKGIAVKSLSLGNLRCIPNARCQENFAWFDSWEQGFIAWYDLIENLYIKQWNRTTIDTIIPKYAPNSDGNNEHGYIISVKNAMTVWSKGEIQVKET